MTCKSSLQATSGLNTMTDYEHAEVSRALALAIGWPESKLYDEGDGSFCCINLSEVSFIECWAEFDYRYPAVIWPIAEKYDCFPFRGDGLGASTGPWRAFVAPYGREFIGESAALAVANAVIGGTK